MRQRRTLMHNMVVSILQLICLLLILRLGIFILSGFINHTGFLYNTLSFIYEYTITPVADFINHYIWQFIIGWCLYMFWWFLTYSKTEIDDIKSFIILRNVLIPPVVLGLCILFVIINITDGFTSMFFSFISVLYGVCIVPAFNILTVQIADLRFQATKK